MEIYIVSTGDTVESIAEKYGVSAQKIIQENELKPKDKLIPGQTIVITYPAKTYTVQEGDTLNDIAIANDVPLMQILRNNPFLFDREYINPGEILTISYDTTNGKINTSGFAYPFISNKILEKTLPSLTYLTIFNYTITQNGELITYYDDTEIIKTAKAYGTAPLMLITSLSTQGVPNIEAAYDILTNEVLQDQYIKIVIDLVKSKGYYGVNISFQYLNKDNQNNYIQLFNKISKSASNAGIPLFVTINPNKTIVGNKIEYEPVNYSYFNQKASRIAFLTFDWATNFGPPMPIASIADVKNLIDYVIQFVSPDEISTGIPILGYDWELPYVAGFSKASALSLDSIKELAISVGAFILFDDISQTPYIRYRELPLGIEHLIWFIDARSINALMTLVEVYKLKGTGVWNIMSYCPQLWLVINSQFEVEKVGADRNNPPRLFQ